jgi:hypothetical protein
MRIGRVWAWPWLAKTSIRLLSNKIRRRFMAYSGCEVKGRLRPQKCNPS